MTLYFVIRMSLCWPSMLLNCKIENTNTSFCMHKQVVKNAITWPSIVVDLHTHNFEVLWMRQSKTSKILLNLVIIILGNTIVKNVFLDFCLNYFLIAEDTYIHMQIWEKKTKKKHLIKGDSNIKRNGKSGLDHLTFGLCSLFYL